MAYPLEDGARIDISVQGVPPGACSPVVMGGASEGASYRLVAGGEEAWLLLAGGVAARDAAASRLAAAGLTVLRACLRRGFRRG
jgi:hypothetical protein